MIVKVQDPSNEIDCIAMTTTSTTQQSLLGCIARGNDNKGNKCKGRMSTTPKQQSKFRVVVCKMQQQPYRAMWGSAVQICQGRVKWVCQRKHASTPKTVCTLPKSFTLPKASTLSTPKMACTLPKASTMSMPCGMNVLEAEYIEYAKDVVYVTKGKYGEYAKGDCICQRGPQQASLQRRQQRTPCQG